MDKPTIVIGHRNPDTDSICSAIAYASMKKRLGENVQAARAGKVNAETKFALDYFGVEPPILVSDLYPRVDDIMITNPITITPEHNLRDLGQIMRGNDIKSISVVNSDDAFVGIVTMGDLAKRYFDELEMQDLSQSGISYENIVKVLDATVITGADLTDKVTGKVLIAAARATTVFQSIKSGDIVLVGNRENSQEGCIRRHVRCLILTNGAAISSDVLSLARSYGAIILRSQYDTYACARLINQSMPVGKIMATGKIVTFQPNDLIYEIKPKMLASNFRSFPVLHDGKLVGMISRSLLLGRAKERVILVDHNEQSQAVFGIEEAEICEIIDHHRLGGLMTNEPIFIRHEPVGCTATIIANLHWHRDLAIERNIAGLLLSAIISDTLLFNSPTCTAVDIMAAKKLATIAGVDLDSYGMELLRAGASFDAGNLAAVVRNELKEFVLGETRIAISQINVIDGESLLVYGQDIVKALWELAESERYDLTECMITDIAKKSTYAFFAGKACDLLDGDDIGERIDSHIYYLDGVVSRKKQMLPKLLTLLSN
ncbi:MAG: putative manganese-dependent inorganic diphosphatase [Bacillota bacterium]